VDGTFWLEDEMAATGTGLGTATAMGHVPIGGKQGSAERLAASPAGRKVYVHMNNTNPILDEGAVEREQLRALGIEVGHDGMEVTV
jgi:pyrroloquinoline quinone biosynthesis protein B